MDGVIDFFERAEAAHDSGHIWTDQPIYLPPRHGVKFTRVNERDDRHLDFEMVGRTDDTFDHPPINSLKLESTSNALAALREWLVGFSTGKRQLHRPMHRNPWI